MNDTSGIRLLCSVFFITFPNSIRSPGINTNTDSIAKNIALIRQIAISGPSLNCINSIAAIPPIVVIELPATSGIELCRAATDVYPTEASVAAGLALGVLMISICTSTTTIRELENTRFMTDRSWGIHSMPEASWVDMERL